ncbi:GFA family protein [Jannaschia sp. W003]|uniref:GFA family protein n=1 Tax=Jannaschia sp. W003 TaxID=2867012 RepID=UPI0021A6903F|nr:GFA family protein [Jannaschia sp. W003]UWQ22043.1 GFA family protein [Jannaschia sp. W003]
MSVDIEPFRRSGRMEGRCDCGAVRVRIDGAHVAAVGACHCGICQRWSGALYASFDAEADAVTVEGEVATYASTDWAERSFCPRCGSHLWYRSTVREAPAYELMPGLFPAAAAFPLISEIYCDKAPAYAALRGEHARASEADYEAKRAARGDDR